LIPAQNDEQPRLSHTNAAGEARMVDVSSKADTLRTATAGGNIRMSAAAITAIRDNAIAKGDVLGVARIAGIMAAKRTAELIPHVDITLSIDETISGIHAEATAVSTGATGVEMEAIVAVSIALATIYDMAKSVDRSMVIGGVRLLRKSGGKSGEYTTGA
jgi:cyclic pyranopterin monophosphate synthase